MEWCSNNARWRARTGLGGLMIALAVAHPTAQATSPQQGGPPPVNATPAPNAITIEQAVRLTVDRNQTLRAQRLTVDEAHADEMTAALKPNPGLSFGADGFTPFSPSQMNFSFFRNDVSYSSSLSYTFERGGKRENRTAVAKDTTSSTLSTVQDTERQLRFQAEQAFVNVLLAKSTLDLAQQDLKNYANVVDVNRQRVQAGDLAEGDFYKITLQELQFQQDVSTAQLGLVQARAQLRQLMGYDSVPDDYDVAGDLVSTKYTLLLEDLKKQALENRPDVVAAHANVKLAQDNLALQKSIRARDVSGNVDYSHTGPDNTFGVGVAFDLAIHDRNQGNIAHAEIAVQQALESESAARFAAITDVENAWAGLQANRQIVDLYQSGFLDQAQQSLDITTYTYQRGAGSLLDLLDAERTYRSTQLGYRQALAAVMTSAKQLNEAVGKQVIQ